MSDAHLNNGSTLIPGTTYLKTKNVFKIWWADLKKKDKVIAKARHVIIALYEEDTQFYFLIWNMFQSFVRANSN